MATITEDYVSFETAKLLKEKGFEGYSILTIYDENAANAYVKELREKHLPYSSDDPKLKEFHYTIPTLQMAMKWLREVHKIFIEIGTSIDLNGDYHHNYSILDKECKYIRKGYTSFDWNYVDACEAAIKYCLENLI